MNNAFKIVLAGAALAAVVAAGIIFLPRDGGNTGGPGPTATPAASPIPLTDTFLPLEPGTHIGAEMLVPVAFTVPDGWEGKIGGPNLVDLGILGKPSGLLFAIFDKVAADPCQSSTGFVELPGKSVEDLVNALSSMPGPEVTDVADISVDGYSGTQLTITAPDSFVGCTTGPDGYTIWQLPLGANFSLAAGQSFEVSIVDVAGTRLVIVRPDEARYTAADKAQVQAVFDSIQIKP